MLRKRCNTERGMAIFSCYTTFTMMTCGWVSAIIDTNYVLVTKYHTLLAKTATNTYCDFNATLTCSVMDEKYNLQCPKLNIYNGIYRNVSFHDMSKFATTSGVSIITLESMKSLSVFNNSSLVSRKICDLSPNNNLSAKTKWQPGETQGAVCCHFISWRKSVSSVETMFA